MTKKNTDNYFEQTGEDVKKKRTKKTIINVIGCCYDDNALTDLFALNELSGQLEFLKSPPWDKNTKKGKTVVDEDLVYFKVYLGRQFKFEPPTSLILEGIIHMAKQKAYHPVRDYLNALKWDGNERLTVWLNKCAGVELNAYTTAIARKVLIAAVARVMAPGVKFDTMMILEGGQGIGKSTMVNVLAGEWFDNISLGSIDKDTIDAMQGRWILEVDELIGFNRQDLEKMKSFLARCVDRARLSYQRTTKPYPRQCVFIGTTNPVGDNTYFRDESGNRRYWPVMCHKIDIPWLKENRDQLFAEAVAAYNAGEEIYLTDPEAIRISKNIQEERLIDDPWSETLAKFMADKKKIYTEYVNMEQLADAVGVKIDKFGRAEQIRIGIIVKKLGYNRKKVTKDGLRCYVYEVGGEDEKSVPSTVPC